MAELSFGVIQDGAFETAVLTWPLDKSLAEGGALSLATIVMKRPGGLLLAVPVDTIPAEERDGISEASLVGPSTLLTVPGVTLGLQPDVVEGIGFDIDVLVVDFSEDVMGGLSTFDPEVHTSDAVHGFTEDLAILPDPSSLLSFAKEWIGVSDSHRAQFYSAEEEVAAPSAKVGATQKAKAAPGEVPKKQPSAKAPAKTPAKMVAEHITNLAQIIPTMAAQLAAIQEEQKKMQEAMQLQDQRSRLRPSQAPVSAAVQDFLALTGPPPKTKNMQLRHPPARVSALVGKDSVLDLAQQSEEAAGSVDPVALAMLEQSRALTTLVAHLQQGDPLIDAPLSSSGTSSRGAQGRENLQRDLANRTGGFYLQVLQNAYKRMYPASPLPASVEEMAKTNFAMGQYLERFGGYGQSKDLGLVMYGLSFVMDAAMNADLEGVREHLALLCVGIEQTVMDGGRWELGYQLTLLEEPPHQMWGSRMSGTHTGRLRSFAPLCPQKWATIALAFIKEMDYINNRRQDAAKKAPVPTPVAAPKHKGKFPKKGGDAGGQNQNVEGQA